jgi:hypothetical protein
MNHNAKLFGFFLLILALIVFGPLALIWCLNTLFPVLNIPFTFETWVAAAVLPSLFKVNISKKG